MKKLVGVISLVMALMLSQNAMALLIEDRIGVYEWMTEGETHTETHDLTDDGVPDHYSVTSATVHLAFADDDKDYEWKWIWQKCDDCRRGGKWVLKVVEGKLEYAIASGEGVSGYYEVDGSHIFGYDWRSITVGQAGIDSLNNNGLLDVSVTAKNRQDGYRTDFWWKKSVLKAYVEKVPVPEPGTLGLLLMGLFGLVFARKARG